MRITILFLLFPFFTFGQDVDGKYLNAIAGDWTGTLTYTDYGDDETKVTLNTRMEADWSGSKGKLKFFYVEPNGEKVSGKQKVKLGEDGMMTMGEDWHIIDFIATSLDSWTLLLEHAGQDNNRRASFRQEVELQEDHLTITKHVKYEGTNSYFQRNKYEFKRPD